VSWSRSWAISSHVTEANKPGGKVTQLSVRTVVTFLTAEYRLLLASTKLYCLVTEAHRRERLARSRYAAAPRPGVEPATIRSDAAYVTSPRHSPWVAKRSFRYPSDCCNRNSNIKSNYAFNSKRGSNISKLLQSLKLLKYAVYVSRSSTGFEKHSTMKLAL